MKNSLARNEGILVESAPLVVRVQTCMQRAEGLRQKGREPEAIELENAVDTVLSALVAHNLRYQFVILPEAVRHQYGVIQENS